MNCIVDESLTSVELLSSVTIKQENELSMDDSFTVYEDRYWILRNGQAIKYGDELLCYKNLKVLYIDLANLKNKFPLTFSCVNIELRKKVII